MQTPPKVAAQSAQLAPDDIPDAFFEGHVPRRASGHGNREGGSSLHDHAAGAVRKTDAGDTQARNDTRIPRMVAVFPAHHVRQPGPERHIAIHHLDFLIQRELRQQFVRLGLNLLAGEFRSRLKAGKSCLIISLGHG